MHDLNDISYFVAVVRHQGFSAAARATGLDKTRLSRRIAALEKRLGVRLLQRSTRSIALTEAGERFFERCLATVEEAEAAYDSIANLRKEPVGTVRMSCPLVLAQTYLAPILPRYMASYPKVNLIIESPDHDINLVEERFDLALFARSEVKDMAGVVVKQLGSAPRIMVASSCYLRQTGKLDVPEDVPKFATLGRLAEMRDGFLRWELTGQHGELSVVKHVPRLVTNDLRLQMEAAVNGIGIALLPAPLVAESIKARLLEQILPQWSSSSNVLCLAYLSPRGILPSVRSVLDYLAEHLPAVIQARIVLADAVRSTP